MYHKLFILMAMTVTQVSPGLTSSAVSAEQWKIANQDGRWTLLKNGNAFYVKGAVGARYPEVLKACGGNALRATPTEATLDSASRLGLAVMANLPVRGERNGMNWDDQAMVAAQASRVLDIVQKWKDHPALMFWTIGNELDHIPGGADYNPMLWSHLNQLARAIKRVDPNHPVLTVVGTGRFRRKIKEVATDCRDIDLLGINCYGDIGEVTEIARRDWGRAYAVTEWGPTGHWQVPKTAWRVPIEQTSSEKAAAIDSRYRNVILADETHCVGSFVFYWSEKQETTHTWYGLFHDGRRTESIDIMQRAWTGRWPDNRAPLIKPIEVSGHEGSRAISVSPGSKYIASVEVSDPDGDVLDYAWQIRPEVEIPAGSYAGSLEEPAAPIDGLMLGRNGSQVEFRAPDKLGPYRLFVNVNDGHGHAAYANLPFLVERRFK